MAPLVLVGSVPAAGSILAALEADGWQPHEGFTPGGTGWDLDARRIVCHGHVRTTAEARAAVLAAARGSGIVAIADLDAPVTVALHDDLRRIGTVDVRRPPVELPLDADQVRMLSMVAAGATLGAVAAEFSYSLRTVNRRLAAARAALGVRTTAQAATTLTTMLGTSAPAQRVERRRRSRSSI
jgi:hypothetical protein